MKPAITFNGKPIDNEELWGDANFGIVQHMPKGTPIPVPSEPPTFDQVAELLLRRLDEQAEDRATD